MSTASATAERYVALAVADAKEGLAELFALDATFEAPDGSHYVGRAQIAAFYKKHLADVVPAFHIHRAVSSGDDQCWIELAYGTPEAPVLIASNHFTVGADGLISNLTVFLRPQPNPT